MAREGAGSYRVKKIKGINKVRKMFNRIDLEERREVQTALASAAITVMNDAKSLARLHGLIRTGAMIDSIAIKFSRDRMTAIIGPGAKSAVVRANPFDTGQFNREVRRFRYEGVKIRHKQAQWNLMKAWWAEFGTGPPVPQPPTPFMNPAWEINKNILTMRVRGSVERVIRRLAQLPDS